MDIIDEDVFENDSDVKDVSVEEIKIRSKPRFDRYSPVRFKQELENMSLPVDEQKRVAVKLKNFLEYLYDKDMAERGFLSDYTRRWYKEYSELLDRIHKSLYGEKNVNLNMTQINVSHAHIAAKIRKIESEKKS